MSIARTAIVFGAFLALFHAVWAGMVLIGWAQPFMDFIFWLHFITPPYRIEPFEPARAGLLLAVTASIGAFAGATFALVWNAARRRQPKA